MSSCNIDHRAAPTLVLSAAEETRHPSPLLGRFFFVLLALAAGSNFSLGCKQTNFSFANKVFRLLDFFTVHRQGGVGAAFNPLDLTLGRPDTRTGIDCFQRLR